MVSVQSIEKEISKKTNPVGGVKVSHDLWKELQIQNKIQDAKFCPVDMPSVVITLPVLKGTNTVVWIDPDLDNEKFELPPNSV
jgi:hypothetical protein